VDVQTYQFELTLPTAGNKISAVANINAWRRLSVDTLVLDLMKMTVDSVYVGATPRAFVRDSATIRIPLLATDGADLRVRIKYQGEPEDGLIIRETADRGWSAFGDNWPNRARYWLPTVDHPSDKAIVQFTVNAPRALTIVANGVERAATGAAQPAGIPAGFAQSRFTIAAPIPTYLMVIAAAKMEKTPLTPGTALRADGQKIEQNVYTFPAEKSYAPGPFVEAGKIIDYFTSIAGPFAYERLNHLQSATKFGGMENATAIFYSDGAFKNHSVGVGLIAHETAHQWFGDAVTPRRWQDLWLSEGFASYLAPLYTQHSRGDSAFRAAMTGVRNQIISAPVVSERPVVDTVGALTPNTLLNANSYQKGAFVLHMLREDVGDEAFFAGMREYQKLYRNGTATTDHLRLVMEKTGGASLKPFFDQWLHRPGFADITVDWRVNRVTKTIRFTVTQGRAFEPFAVPVVVALRDKAGKEQRHTLHLQAQTEQTFEFPLIAVEQPTVVVLDPDVKLLAKLTVTTQ
jgi:aminopeptidase N